MIPIKVQKKLISLVYELGSEVEGIKTDSNKISVEYKNDNTPLTRADKLVNEEITKFIATTDFHNYISEESVYKNYQIRKNWKYFWLIDPIDGTKEFVKKGEDYTINVALCFENMPIFSIVYAPAKNELFHATKENNAFLNNERISVNLEETNSINIVASSSHFDTKTSDYLKELEKYKEINLLQFGSSLKICKVASGIADIYPRFGPTMEWDTCAAHLILSEAGGEMLKMNGSSLHYNKKHLNNPHFIAKSKKFKTIFP